MQVHHIVPRHYAWHIKNWELDRINSPFNGITICHKCHKLIHDGTRDKEIIYWNDDFDKYLKEKAYTRTIRFIQQDQRERVLEVFDLAEFQVALIISVL